MWFTSTPFCIDAKIDECYDTKNEDFRLTRKILLPSMKLALTPMIRHDTRQLQFRTFPDLLLPIYSGFLTNTFA